MEGGLGVRCAFGATFKEQVYFSLVFPMVVATIMFVLAVALCKISTSFESLRSTLWLFATVGVYSFGAPVISNLFVTFPCFDGLSTDRRMVHDPSTECYGDDTLVVLSVIGICVYGTTTAYVLGVALWNRRHIIKCPSEYERGVVESTYKAFGFLFYGAQASNAD